MSLESKARQYLPWVWEVITEFPLSMFSNVLAISFQVDAYYIMLTMSQIKPSLDQTSTVRASFNHWSPSVWLSFVSRTFLKYQNFTLKDVFPVLKKKKIFKTIFFGYHKNFHKI